MNIPITRKTPLCLALAASLAFLGDYAAAGVYSTNSDGVAEYTSNEGESVSLNIFTSSGVTSEGTTYYPNKGAIIKIDNGAVTTANIRGVYITSDYEVDGDIDITIDNLSADESTLYGLAATASATVDGDININLSESDINVVYGAFYYGSSATAIATAPFSVGNINITMAGGSGTYIYALRIGNYTTDGAENTIGAISVALSDSAAISGDVFGYYTNSTTAIPNTKTTIDSISITETNASVVGTIYGIDHVNQSILEITEGVTISLTDSDVSRIYGAYSTGGTVKITEGITIKITGGEVKYYGNHLSNIIGFCLDNDTNEATNNIGAITITVSDSGGSGSFYGYSATESTSSVSDTTIGSITMSVTNVAAESDARRTVGGVFKQDNGSLTIGEGGITISSIDSASYTVFGISSAGGNVTINGDISVTLVNKEGDSSAHGLVYGAYLTGGADDVKFITKDISVDVEGATVTNAGSIYGVRVNGDYAGDVTFTSGNITIKMVGDKTTSNIYGYDLNPESETKVTSVVGIISLDVNGGAESGAFYGYYSGGDVSAASTTQIESIDVTVSGLDLEEGSFAGAISGVYKQDPGTLTVGDVTVTTALAADTYVRGIYSSAGTVTVNGDVSVTTSSTTDSHVQGVYIGGGTFNITGDIILTLTDLNMPSTATDENIEGFRLGEDGKATLGGNITITAIADPYIDGDGFDHDIIGAAIVYDSTGSVEQSGSITITIGGANKDLNLIGTIYGLVVASDSATYNLGGTTKLVFGGDTAFVSDDDESALAGTFANFKEVEITNGSSLFIDPDLQGELSGDMDVFGSTGRPADKYITDIYSENGTLTLSAADNTLTIDEGGKAYIDKLVNVGTVADEGDLTITRGTNSGTIKGENGILVLGTPKDTTETFVSTGTIDIPTFTLGANATLDEQEGTVTVKTKADLTAAGYMAIGAPATAELNVDGTINAQVSVLGKLAIGTPDKFAWTDDALSAAGISATSNILALKSLVTTGSTGYITVGNGVSVLSASDTPGLNFGSDSVLVVDAGMLTVNDLSSSAFTTTASGATVTVDSGGTVVLYGAINKGRYNITSGYDFGSDVEGWYKPTIDDSDDYVKVVDSAGITWNYYRGSDEQDGVQYVFIETTSHDPSSENFPDVNIPNIVDDDLDACKDGDYICGIVRDSDLTNDEKTKIINSSSTLLFDGGVTAVSRDGAGLAMDHLYNHLTMDSDTFDKDAKLWQYEESENLWIDVMGGWSKAKSLFKATGLSSYGYRNHSFGFITGWDHKFEDRPFVLGVAVSFEKGSLKSRGSSVSPTKNEYKNYGVHIFGNYSENEHLNLIGSLHWLHNNSGVNQSTGVSEFSTASASMHINTFAAGLRAETMIKAGDINVIPHVEARYMYGKTRAFDTKVSGTKVWRTKADGTHTLQIPFGVAFRTDKKFDNGWNIRPNLDLEAIPQIGNTKQKTVVTNFNGVSDVIVGQFAGKWAGQARVGFQADKKNATIGAHYSFLGGTKGRAGHTFMLQARTRF